MNKHSSCGSAVLMILLLSCGTAPNENVQLPIQDHQAAINIANRVSGFDRLPNFSEIAITVQKVAVAEDNTVLYECIEGRTFWKVSYSDFAIERYEEINPYINTFDVLVDVKTGRVPKIASRWLSEISPKYRQREAEWIARMRKQMGSLKTGAQIGDTRYIERYELYRVPERYPRITFLECLNFFGARPSPSSRSEHHEKYIAGVYRWDMDVVDGEEVIVPVWDMIGYGGNYFTGSSPAFEMADSYEPPTDDTGIQKNLIINAKTGRIILSSR